MVLHTNLSTNYCGFMLMTLIYTVQLGDEAELHELFCRQRLHVSVNLLNIYDIG